MLTKKDIQQVKDNIKRIYLEDGIPWVVGYSGGKDSTAILQLVWESLLELESGQRHKKVFVVTNDTLVESPIVSAWVKKSHERLGESAQKCDLPIEAHIVYPAIKDTFWVNLIGRGYPYPRQNFRWCTDRLKIKPTNTFVQKMVSAYGEVILVLGTRKQESANRMRTITEHEKYEVRPSLTAKSNMQNELSFTPIKEWSDDEVWQYLLQHQNPWGHSNQDLLTMYKGATADGECPLVRDVNTPSCGKSRFGCWVCTLVERDKSMEAMIQNDEEKEWMLPLLQFRDKFGDHEYDRSRREFSRMSGELKLYNNRLVHGPYTKATRQEWLRELLTIENQIQKTGPAWFGEGQIISTQELLEIRRIWIEEKHEYEDSVAKIYQEVKGKELQVGKAYKHAFNPNEYGLLKEICDTEYPEEELLFRMTASLLEVERQAQSSKYRQGIGVKLQKIIQSNCFQNEADALGYAQMRLERQEKILGNKDENESIDNA